MTHTELLDALLTERFATPTPPPGRLPHISTSALRELLEDLKPEEDVA